MQFLKVIVKNTVRRPLRSLLTVIAIAIAVGSVVSLVGIASDSRKRFSACTKARASTWSCCGRGPSRSWRARLTSRWARRSRRCQGVRDVIPGLADVTSFEEFNLLAVPVQGWVPETKVFDHIQVLSGRSLKRDDQKSVILGSILAKNLEMKEGDHLELYPDEVFTVVGTYRANNVIETGALVIPMAQLQRIMNETGKVTGFSLVPEDSGDKAAVARVRSAVVALARG